jgi:copper chaperone CopZ
MNCCANKDAKDRSPATPAAGGHAPRAERLTLAGSVAAAILSSACCWLPLLLLAFGASAAGVSGFFERWRPVFLIVAAALLGAGFYVVCFRKASCADGACEAAPRSRRVFSQVMLWVAAALVGAFALFPKYAGTVAGMVHGSRGADESSAGVSSAALHRFAVEGMTCEACATTLQADLEKIEGIASARVDFSTKTAEVRSDAAGVDALVRAAAERHGYRALPR